MAQTNPQKCLKQINSKPIANTPMVEQVAQVAQIAPAVSQMPPTAQVMPMPTNVNAVHCPPGLEYLLVVDQLLIKQKVEVIEAVIGFETNNKYEIQNSLGQKIFFVAEQNDCCTRNFCGPTRPFEIRIIDYYEREVMHLSRPLRCDTCLFPCCLQHIRVESPSGLCIGFVVQDWHCLRPIYHIESPTGERWLRIRGPICTFSCFCKDVTFKVLAINDDIVVGKISKQWSGVIHETFTDADNFAVTFPMDLDIRIKACLLAATFLIDYMYFETTY